MTNTPGTNLIIVDSDALIGIVHDVDNLHNRCLSVSLFLAENSFVSITPYPIVLEAATTLSRRMKKPELASQLLFDFVDSEQNKDTNYNVAEIVSDLYNPKTSKKNTPFDHYVLALAKKNNIKYVFSFDKFYEKNGLILAEDLVKKVKHSG